MFKLTAELIKQLLDSKHHGYKSYIRNGKLTAGDLASILDSKYSECPKSVVDLLREAEVNDSRSD